MGTNCDIPTLSIIEYKNVRNSIHDIKIVYVVLFYFPMSTGNIKVPWKKPV